MALLIRTTGLEHFAPGGEARLKLLIVGGPGVGKTRFSSFFPNPIYADCEAGLASVADRRVPYVGVNTSGDMLDLLTHLKQECRLPKGKRTYDTVVIDTLDAYQRKLKAEWMDREKKEAFTGWEAWGFVGQKMQLLLTRLLNLDMNVIVNVHYKDKTTRDDDSGKETHELMLQLQGEIADTAFNDFDLVGWMGTYWEAIGGERIQKRGLTFQPTPDKGFLKDRLNATEKWMEVTFEPSDYENLFKRISDRVNALEPGEAVGEIPSANPDDDAAATVVRPEQATSGPLVVKKAPSPSLTTMDRPTLAKRARDLGVTKLSDGSPIRGNATKSELVDAIKAHEANPPEPPALQLAEQATEKLAAVEPPPAKAPTRVTVPLQHESPDIEQVSEGLVNTKTGELITPEPTVEQAVATVEDKLGGTVLPSVPVVNLPAERNPDPEPLTPAPPRQKVPEPVTDGPLCEECSTPLSEQNQDYVKLAWIKYRKRLCQEHYIAMKTR